ncbi:hypothetical protein HanPI659440_Chr00c06g0716981 [Helianthus annuus]|nr:hypothetical protein HanPI659440_Chr00c06g0716981 [Helianthus annuus]
MLGTSKIMAEMEEDGEDEGTSQPRMRGAALNRDCEGAHERLVGDYFAENCVYTDEQVRRRFRMSRHERLVGDYFAENCVYTGKQFRRRFCMSRRLFVRIANDLANYDEVFTLRYDARGRKGFTKFQKVHFGTLSN